MQSNFTNLSDIIDLDEPGNDNENNDTQIDNFSSPIIKKNRPIKEISGMGGGMGSGMGGGMGSGMGISEKFNSFSQEPNFLPNLNNMKSKSFGGNLNRFPQRQNYFGQSFNKRPNIVKRLPSKITKSEHNFPIEHLTSHKIDDMSDKYEQLCEICNKIYHNNNQMHTMYIVVIVSLFIIILMLLKKILK